MQMQLRPKFKALCSTSNFTLKGYFLFYVGLYEAPWSSRSYMQKITVSSLAVALGLKQFSLGLRSLNRTTSVFSRTSAAIPTIVPKKSVVWQQWKALHVKGHVYLRLMNLLVAKRRVAVGTVYNSTMLCFLPSHCAPLLYKEQADSYLLQARDLVGIRASYNPT